MSEDEARGFIKTVFERYQALKGDDIKENIPQNIIMMYYNYIKITSFEEIVNGFKRKYIFNETLLEGASKKERLGLGEMYDYIKDYDCNNKITVYHILKLHQLIYSKCDYPEFGGTFRKDDRYLPGSGVVIPEYDHVPYLMSDMYTRVGSLLSKAEKAQKEGNFDVIAYINECVDIKCELIRIHPFPDGNGRSSRGFLNLLFKNVGLPPVYVKNSQKEVYCRALNKALVDNDYQSIHTFYHHLLCYSVYELDIKMDDYVKPANQI